MAGKTGRKPARKRAARVAPRHPHGVATLAAEPEIDEAPDQPFVAGADDQLDPDLRHRLISEAAFHRQIERGYNSDYEGEDWLDAEAAVDHVIVNGRPGGRSRGAT
ncbi:MAG TPA: hypothetical protein VF814_02355 [Casimicrobiaceae bacterium]